MGRRYRRRKRSNSLSGVVAEVVKAAARLPWWGALSLGLISYFVVSVGVGGFVESRLAAQEVGSIGHAVLGPRLGKIIRVTEWIGRACIIAACFFAIRNYFWGTTAGRTEKGAVNFISKIIGRNID